MRFADGVIFLTEYAAKVIQQTTGMLAPDRGNPSRCRHARSVERNVAGRVAVPSQREPSAASMSPTPRCTSTNGSSCKAIGHLRSRGYNIELVTRWRRLGARLRECSRRRSRAPIRSGRSSSGWVSCRMTICRRLLADANLFVFASSCENMPNTLVEAMAIGLPIACSDRGPMPEVLRDGGVYFDPEDCDVDRGAPSRH